MLDNEKFIRKLYTYAEGQGLDTEKFVSMFSDDGYMLARIRRITHKSVGPEARFRYHFQ